MISVLITTKNRIDYLKRAVSSVINSSLCPDEIVVVNDGGELLTKDMLSVPENDIKLVIINNELSYGANKARNLAIKKCSGDFVFFLDDDDYLEIDSISKRIGAFDDPNVGLVSCGFSVVKSSDLDVKSRVKIPRLHKVTFDDLIKNGNIIGSTSLVCARRSVLFDSGLFDESLPCFQDYDLWLRVSKLSNIVIINEALIRYTIHDKSQQISSQWNKYFSTSLYLVEKYSSLIENNKLSRVFYSNLLFRVALSASNTSYFHQLKFLMMSLSYKFKINRLPLFFPKKIIEVFYPYT